MSGNRPATQETAACRGRPVCSQLEREEQSGGLLEVDWTGTTLQVRFRSKVM